MRDILKQQLKRQLKEQLGQPPGSDPPTVASEFEVRCYDCDVSFPAETRRCMYCGERLGHRPLFTAEIAGDPLGDFPALDDAGQPRQQPERESEEEPEQARGSVFRLFGNMTWIILFALLTLYRWCSG